MQRLQQENGQVQWVVVEPARRHDGGPVSRRAAAPAPGVASMPAPVDDGPAAGGVEHSATAASARSTAAAAAVADQEPRDDRCPNDCCISHSPNYSAVSGSTPHHQSRNVVLS